MDLKAPLKQLPTYQVGLLHNQAYRNLTDFLAAVLKQHSNVSVSEWTFLGVVYDHKKVRMQELASLLHIEASFATKLRNKLVRSKLIMSHTDVSDSRVRIVTLSIKGKSTVESTEKILRGELNKYLKSISKPELFVYLRVVNRIANLTSKVPSTSKKKK